MAGILNFDGAPCDPDDVRTFTDSLAHRGPDGSGVHTDDIVGLGHRRLAILDLTEHGRQPLSDPDGRFWITFNGEIYNFLELRRELRSEGHCFRTETDTEVILAAYRQWGASCVLRFNGMWAFAIWDAARRELFLSRDRFGVKPLRYLHDGRRFAFASELKAFRHLPGFSPRENVAEMRNLLARGGMSMEETPFEGVKRLPGGYNMLVRADGTMQKWRWWRTIEHLPEVPATFGEQVEQFRELLFDAVRVRLRSDVPVATCLSGGLDSSSIVCSLPHLTRSPGERQAADCHQAFVARFPGTPWDEYEYAATAIERGEVDAHLVEVDADAVLEGIEQYCYDIEMCGDRLSIPLWLTYRAQRRQGIVVTVDGQGADEMLAGYHRPFINALQSRGSLLRSPVRTIDMARTVSGIYGGVGDKRTMAVLMDGDPILRAGRRAWRRGRAALASRFSTQDGDAGHDAGAWAPSVPPITYMDRDTIETAEALGPFRGFLYKEFHGTTLVNVLRSFDRCSMAHGVEIRMPFLDWRLVTFVFALPERSIAGGGYTKRILREAMRGVLPEKIRTRKPKLGFSSPLPNWFAGPVGDWVWREVQTPAFLNSELWNGPAIRDFVRTRRAAGAWTLGEAQRVWRFVQANRWRQTVHA